jgi:hypothetical protein
MKRLTTALTAACALTIALAACEDIPLLPRWDADWYVPLPSQAISVPFSGSIPAGVGAPASFTEQQEMEGSIGDILRETLRGATVIITLTKSVALQVDDTLVVSNNAADTLNPAAAPIFMSLAMATTDTETDDTLVVSQAGIDMLRATAEAQGTLFVHVRGQLSNPGPGSVTVNPSDSIGVRIALIARIAMSREGEN